MRTLMKVSIPVEAGNKGIVEGTLQKSIVGFIEQYKPEACYFLPEGGKRTAYAVVDVPEPSYIPALAEPFFIGFNASIELWPVMNADHLKAGLDKIRRK